MRWREKWVRQFETLVTGEQVTSEPLGPQVPGRENGRGARCQKRIARKILRGAINFQSSPTMRRTMRSRYTG